MKVENAVYPLPEQLRALFQAPAPDGPIVMVNLLKFRERAIYPDGSDSELSGREAYMRYARAVGALIESIGGSVVYVGDVSFLAIGSVEQLWDEVALARYPSRAEFLRMTTSPDWREIEVHREAGLEGQLNIETVPSESAIRAGR